MARFHSLIVYTLARENLREAGLLTRHMPGFGDPVNQMRRSGISAVSITDETSP